MGRAPSSRAVSTRAAGEGGKEEGRILSYGAPPQQQGHQYPWAAGEGGFQVKGR